MKALRQTSRRVAGCLAIVAVACLGHATVVHAQDAVPQPPAQFAAQRSPSPAYPGFMFGAPRVYFGVRGNWMLANTGSDIYDFVTDELTLDKHDFNVKTVSTDFAISLTPRLDVVVGLDVSKSHAQSEYRDYVDNRLNPIVQFTTLHRTDVGVGVRYAVTPRGRRVSRYAWIPNAVTPYAGAGVGAMYYHFLQSGEFVDFADMGVFASAFRSEGWAPSAHALAGVDLRVYRRLYLSGEARYVWSSAKLGSDFVDFAPMSLGGIRFGAGARLAF